MVAPVGHHAKQLRGLVAEDGEIVLGGRQGVVHAGGVALVGRIHLYSQHGAGGKINRVFGLVGKTGGAVLHPGDAGIRVGLRLPLPVGKLLAITFFVETDNGSGIIVFQRAVSPALI